MVSQFSLRSLDCIRILGLFANASLRRLMNCLRAIVIRLYAYDFDALNFFITSLTVVSGLFAIKLATSTTLLICLLLLGGSAFHRNDSSPMLNSHILHFIGIQVCLHWYVVWGFSSHNQSNHGETSVKVTQVTSVSLIHVIVIGHTFLLSKNNSCGHVAKPNQQKTYERYDQH
jgi:hypothetical protein